LAISGIPPFAGFFSKDEILAHAFEANPVVWGLALLTSLLTAFYMFRLLFLTFFGTSRASHDTLHHIHESPASITLPLMALAALSTVGGWIGIPESLGGSNRIHEFLNPVFAKSQSLMAADHLNHATEYTLMTTVMVLTLVMITVAYFFYVKRSTIPVEEGAKLNPVHQLLYRKYFVDELYDKIIVKPLYRMASMLDSLVERLGIDRLVNSVGDSVVDGSSVMRLLQTGNIGFYVFAMVVGIILMLATTLMMK
jgi:NADH-quinone oxidoreductase subunit L